ncbi:actin-like family protein ARP4a, putative [Eimeria necatrix]|uniref:Actin-like family protein ARP4a, putative n=1 Tax=Eimeria necatrix TaxID=51315 RepID=U6MUF4_9EIME|nr:actin-like family protein ARP4a, putative [Eimeria necatrix]CDJ65320.1 actin-like family protein ARP4a, putative [Eimeria necatrix]
MELISSSLVIDIGASSTRVGYAGEGSPSQLLNSCIGVRQLRGPQEGLSAENHGRSNTTREIIFPLNFSQRRDCVEVVPALFPSWRGATGKRKMDFNPVYTLHEEAFENLVALSCTGARAARFGRRGDEAYPNCVDSNGSTRSPESTLRLTELCGIGADLREQPLLLSEPNIHSREVREKIAEILFESLQVGSLYTAKRALLACVALGRSSALVIDMGASGLSIAPVSDSFVLDQHVTEWPVGGDAMSQLLSAVLVGHNFPVHPSFARFSAQSRMVKVSLDKPGDWDNVHPSYMHWSRMQTLSFLKEGLCRVADDPRDVALAQKPIALPSPQQQTKRRGVATSEASGSSQLIFPCSTGASAAALLSGGSGVEGGLPEILFCPALVSSVPGGGGGFPGLPDAVRQVAEAVETDGNRDILSALILTGGCSCIPGMVERVNRELVEDPAICGGQKVRLLAVPGSSERRYSTWVGGSILSSLSSFQAAWCSREEYEEHGPAVVQRKCY